MLGEIIAILGVRVALAGLMLTNSRGLRQARVAGRPGRREIDFGGTVRGNHQV